MRKETGKLSKADEAAYGLDMDNFFQAVKEIRQRGVPFYDEEHDAYFAIKVDMKELAEHEPEIFMADDSLEAALYGVFEAIHDPEWKSSETRGYFDAAWRHFNRDKDMKELGPRFIAHRALVNALNRWLHGIMEPILVKQVQELSEEDVLKKCKELDRGNGKQKIN